MASQSVTANFGEIDDDGWVYVNGQFVGESHDWTAAPTMEVRKFLHDGENTIAVAVQNNESTGGLEKGVSLEIEDKPEPIHWKRSAFNGLAQVIVQAGKEAGTMHLTAKSEGLTEASVDISSAADSTLPLLP
jgi:hypothetical protein